MKATTRKGKSQAEHRVLRGMRVRLAFEAAGVSRPMTLVELIRPDMTNEEKQQVRLFLNGRTPKLMTDELMDAVEQALSIIPKRNKTAA